MKRLMAVLFGFPGAGLAVTVVNNAFERTLALVKVHPFTVDNRLGCNRLSTIAFIFKLNGLDRVVLGRIAYVTMVSYGGYLCQVINRGVPGRTLGLTIRQ